MELSLSPLSLSLSLSECLKMYGLVFVLSFVCACVTFFKIFYLYFLHFFSVFVKYKGSRQTYFDKILSKIEKVV